MGIDLQLNLPQSPASADSRFDDLCGRVHACLLCPRMRSSQRVLNRSVGPLKAPILFIGEAPGRLGADGSGIPFHGDKAGHNFENLLEAVGIERDSVFVTNAVLCNPKDDSGNNATPEKSEIHNCSNFLREQIEIVNPKIVVTLGMTALKAVDLVCGHGLNLREHVRTSRVWNGRLLIPLYHPGQRAMIHRNFFNQRSDYQFVAETMRRLGGTRKKKYGELASTTTPILVEILSFVPVLSYFALHKLFYLIEVAATKRYGHRLTRAYFVRQKDGPYCTELHPYKLKKALPEIDFRMKGGKLFLHGGAQSPDLFRRDSAVESGHIELVRAIVEKYCTKSDAELKTAVYLTSPMKRLLRLERLGGVNTYNAPIDFGYSASE